MSDQPKPNLTSTEAAALYLSDGRTKDPTLAVALDQSSQADLGLDNLQRAHLRRMMGFDFRMKLQPNKIHVSSRQQPYVSTWCRLKPGDTVADKLVNEDAVDRLVDACLRLKLKYEAEVRKAS